MINIRDATKLPNIASLPLPESKPTELESIELVGATRPGGKRLVRVGSAVTNERFRRWCKKEGKVTLPLNVIMVEITLGGSNGPIWYVTFEVYLVSSLTASKLVTEQEKSTRHSAISSRESNTLTLMARLVSSRRVTLDFSKLQADALA